MEPIPEIHHHCPRCGYDLDHHQGAPGEEPPPAVAPSTVGSGDDAPAGHRWLEVSVACPECAEQVEVYTAAAQGEDELDERVYAHPGDLYLCGDGHLGSIVVHPSDRAAYLGEPALADQTRESAETLAREPGPVARHLRAPIRGVAS